MSKMVIIRHPKTGVEAAILPADFTKPSLHPKGTGSYAEQGYVIERYEDGTDYAGPKSKREMDKAAADKQSAKDAPKGKAS